MSQKPEVLAYTGIFVMLLRTVLLVTAGVLMALHVDLSGALAVAALVVTAVCELWCYECWKSRP